jgi:hypothetical protein
METDLTQAAIRQLERLGHTVTRENIPGLYRINGGPELTRNQLISIATKPKPDAVNWQSDHRERFFEPK